jgi:hypothetical protein
MNYVIYPSRQKWIGISKYLFNFCELKVHFFDPSGQDIFSVVSVFSGYRSRVYCGAHITTFSLIQPRATTA